MVVVVMLVGCATTRTVQTKTTACDGVMSRFEDRAKLPREERLTLRNEALKCLDANEPEAAAALRTNTHREFLQADLEDALATADEAKAMGQVAHEDARIRHLFAMDRRDRRDPARERVAERREDDGDGA